MIDRNTGRLTFNSSKTISPTTTLSEIKAFKLSEVQEERVMGNGWVHYTFKNVEDSGNFFHLTFSCYEGTFKSISFVVNDSPFDLNSNWDSWSEQRELERAVFYNNWLNKELGTGRVFPWGTVWAGYDPKGGGSSISIRYK